MDCSICVKPLAGRVVFRCECGALTHGHCWEKHVFQAHKPPFILGSVDLDGKFVPRQTVPRKGKRADEKGPAQRSPQAVAQSSEE